jgi:hypothetical protein
MADTQDVEALVAELGHFASACGAEGPGDGAFSVRTHTGTETYETERNLRAVLREAATALRTLARERDEALSAVAAGCYEAALKGGSELWQHTVALGVERQRAAESRASSLEAQLAGAKEALEPFAQTAEHDIGSDETEADIFQQCQHNRAPKITVGHFRRARAVYEALASAPASAGVGVKALEWSDPSPPNDDCRYDHVVAATP